MFSLEKYFTNSSSTFELSNKEVLIAIFVPEQIDTSNCFPVSG